MRIFKIILTILSPFLCIVQPTIERNSHHCQLCYQTYLSVTILKVTLLTVTELTFLNKKLITETTGRGYFTIKAEMCFYISANLKNGNPKHVAKVEKFVESNNI